MSKGCNATLTPGQWWRFCGETDMGQTLPALCTECGGSYIRADDPDAEAKVAEANKATKCVNKVLGCTAQEGWTVYHAEGLKPKFVMFKSTYVGDGKETKTVYTDLAEANNRIAQLEALIRDVAIVKLERAAAKLEVAIDADTSAEYEAIDKLREAINAGNQR